MPLGERLFGKTPERGLSVCWCDKSKIYVDYPEITGAWAAQPCWEPTRIRLNFSLQVSSAVMFLSQRYEDQKRPFLQGKILRLQVVVKIDCSSTPLHGPSWHRLWLTHSWLLSVHESMRVHDVCGGRNSQRKKRIQADFSVFLCSGVWCVMCEAETDDHCHLSRYQKKRADDGSYLLVHTQGIRVSSKCFLSLL